MSITADKYIRFYLANFSNILSLKEIIDHAESNIPHIIKKEVKKYILDCGVNVNFDFDENGNIWWATEKIYNYEDEQGLYFTFEENIESIFGENDPEDASCLCAYVDVGKIRQKYKKKEYLDQWHNKFKTNISALNERNIQLVLPLTYSDPYIVKYPLHREINISNIADKNKFKSTIQNCVKTFTNTCLSIATS